MNKVASISLVAVCTRRMIQFAGHCSIVLSEILLLLQNILLGHFLFLVNNKLLVVLLIEFHQKLSKRIVIIIPGAPLVVQFYDTFFKRLTIILKVLHLSLPNGLNQRKGKSIFHFILDKVQSNFSYNLKDNVRVLRIKTLRQSIAECLRCIRLLSAVFNIPFPISIKIIKILLERLRNSTRQILLIPLTCFRSRYRTITTNRLFIWIARDEHIFEIDNLHYA